MDLDVDEAEERLAALDRDGWSAQLRAPRPELRGVSSPAFFQGLTHDPQSPTPPSATDRFAFYGRLSTTDKQDPALSFPSQRKACERRAAELGGEITCEFTNQESGAKQDRPCWTALTGEARDRRGRRFDAVIVYATSRLARDRLYVALFERELRKVGVAIHYAMGAGDPSTTEGQVFIGMQQLWDEFERNKLARETKRGMREATEQGYRMGGVAPYGYPRKEHDLPEGHRGDTDKKRVTLAPDPERGPVVAEIFHLHADKGWSPKAIATT
jgi:site-specific DNA recombinase